MSERYPIPTDAAKVGWRTNPSGNTITEPNASKRADGYVFEEEVPYDELNWEMKLWGDLLLWLQGFSPREWSEIREGIEAASPPDLFRVHQPASDNWARGEQAFGLTPTSFVGRSWVAGDGQRFYASSNAGRWAGLDPVDGSEDWNVNTFSGGLVSLGKPAADGLNVYIMGASAAVGLVLLDPSDGTERARGGTQYGGTACRIAANGAYAVVGQPGGNVTRIYYYDTLGGTPNETGFTDHGVAINDVAIDAEAAYFGGAPNGAVTPIRSHKLSDRTQIWFVNLPATTSAPTIYAIATDGNHVYVGTDRQQLTATSAYVNLFCLDRLDGSMLWAIDVQAPAMTDPVESLCIDDRYLYATTNGTEIWTHVIDLSRPEPWPVWRIEDQQAEACDGISFASVTGTTTAPVYRNYWMDHTRTFQRVNGNDPSRAPFHNLAIPTER